MEDNNKETAGEGSFDLIDLFRKCRSCRRFFQDSPVDDASLEKMIEAARFSPSSRNIQCLKYFLCNDPELCARIFPTLSWAGYLKTWDGPEEGERPSAYIVQLHDTRISPSHSCDDGIAAESIMMEASFLGFGGCIIDSVRRDVLSDILQLPDYMKILRVLAVGVPKEKIVVEDMADGNCRYWRDAEGVHHVPKRSVEELIFQHNLDLKMF